MKRVLRSCLDPLPRLISLKSLVAVVIVLLAGTGISVYEYLESAHLPMRNEVRAAAESTPASRASAEDRSKCTLRTDGGQRVTAPQSRVTDRGISSRTESRDAAAVSEVPRAPASAFDPRAETAGS
jgi:hypothetical protein